MQMKQRGLEEALFIIFMQMKKTGLCADFCR